MNIKNKEITLRAIEQKDLLMLHKWSNDPDIQHLLGGWHPPTSEFVMEKWFEKITTDNLNIRFAIEHNHLGLIGTCGITDINWKDKNAFHGILLGEKSLHGKGLGTQIVSLIMDYAFNELGLKRLDTTIIEYNFASIKLYTEKCGWSIEGRKKNGYYRKGRYWEKLILGITIDEYNKTQNT